MMIAILCDDLFSRAKVEEILDQLGIEHVVLSEPYDFHRLNVQKFIVDLTQPFGFELLKKMPEKCIAFGPHVRAELFRKAQELGCKEVYPRSIFFDELIKKFKE